MFYWRCRHSHLQIWQRCWEAANQRWCTHHRWKWGVWGWYIHLYTSRKLISLHETATRGIPTTNKQLHQVGPFKAESAEVKAWATRASREKSQQDENYGIYANIYIYIYWYFCKNLLNINMSLESGGCKFPHANLTCCAAEHSVERSPIATKLACWPLIGQIPVKSGFSCTCGLTCLSVSRQISQNGIVKQKPLPKKVSSMSRAGKTFTAVHLVLVTDWKFFPEPPVQFLNPPEQVEVRVGERAQLHCQFRSSSVPVACCWIYNRDKVKKWVYFVFWPI